MIVGAGREPLRVALHERDVLAVARALFDHGSWVTIESTLGSSASLETLGPAAMSLLEETIAKGVVKTLMRLGGARSRLRPGMAAAGRPAAAFEVRAVPVLAFGPHAFELVRWLARASSDAPPLVAVPRAIGDHVLSYLALRLVAGTRMERQLARQPALRSSPLAWLGHARALALAESGDPGPPDPTALGRLLAEDAGRTVVECLAGDLALRWTHASLAPARDLLEAPDALRVAMAEQRTLEGFLDAVERVERWDLATFLVDAGIHLLGRGTSVAAAAARASPAVRPIGPLRERSEARRRAGAVFRALTRLGERREQLALVRFFEDGYEDAQCLLGSWEDFGRDGFGRAKDVVQALATLEGPPSPALAGGDKEER